MTTRKRHSVGRAHDNEATSARKKFVTDTCHYCKRSYHPMPVWARADERRYVCNDLVWDSLDAKKTDCTSKANTDGFHYRPDLTPKR